VFSKRIREMWKNIFSIDYMRDYLEKWHREMWAYVQMNYKVIFESLKRFEKEKTI